jgi:uncharacterized protein YbaP (TraB family)
MSDVKLEDAERVAGEIQFFADVGTVSIEMEDELRLAAALLRKIPELQQNLQQSKHCHRIAAEQVLRLERLLRERTAELEAERTRAHNLAEYIRERV